MPTQKNTRLDVHVSTKNKRAQLNANVKTAKMSMAQEPIHHTQSNRPKQSENRDI